MEVVQIIYIFILYIYLEFIHFLYGRYAANIPSPLSLSFPT